MALTIATLTDFVYQRISKGQPQMATKIRRSSIESQINAALQRLADRVARSKEGKLYVILRQPYAVTLGVAGTVQLTGNDLNGNSLDAALIETVADRGQYITVSAGTSYSLEWLPHRSDLDNPPNLADRFFYTITSQRTLGVVDNTGTFITTQPTVNFTANYIPTLANLPQQLEDNLIAVLTEIVLEQGPDVEAEAGATANAESKMVTG